MITTEPTAAMLEQRLVEELRLRSCSAAAAGREPRARRIRQIACRIGGHDVEIEVGLPDPVHGADVVAILDLGARMPFDVYTTEDRDAPRFQISKHIYSVTDFD